MDAWIGVVVILGAASFALLLTFPLWQWIARQFRQMHAALHKVWEQTRNE